MTPAPHPSIQPTRYLTPEDVGQLLRWNVDVKTVKRRLRNIPQSQLPYIPMIGRERLYREADVIHFIESRRVA